MLKLSHSDIQLEQHADDKFAAIEKLASALAEKGLVESGYVAGMLARENQNSTYLGNGIAIPHGTTDTRDLVQKTGVVVHHFPQGIQWGEDQTVYVAIGIAAKSDEHLSILKQLTRVLGADGIEERLQHATDADTLIALLNGDVQLEADLATSNIQLAFPATDMLQMSAVAGGLLKNSGHANATFVADLVSKIATHLGQGLWLVGSQQGVTRTALSMVTCANAFEHQGLPVKGLIAIASCNNAHQTLMSNLSKLVFEQKQALLLEATPEQILALLSGEGAAEPASENGNRATFRIRNAHGLHARPGAMLVAEAKKFAADIRVANLDGDGKVVNAKSLMKVIALGVKHGHQLQFTAEGDDAEQAIAAIGAAIDAGLGEG